jgi:hypothetical protein
MQQEYNIVFMTFFVSQSVKYPSRPMKYMILSDSYISHHSVLSFTKITQNAIITTIFKSLISKSFDRILMCVLWRYKYECKHSYKEYTLCWRWCRSEPCYTTRRLMLLDHPCHHCDRGFE